MLGRDFEDEVWLRFVFELVIWPNRLLWKDELNLRVRCAFGNVSLIWSAQKGLTLWPFVEIKLSDVIRVTAYEFLWWIITLKQWSPLPFITREHSSLTNLRNVVEVLLACIMTSTTQVTKFIAKRTYLHSKSQMQMCKTKNFSPNGKAELSVDSCPIGWIEENRHSPSGILGQSKKT